jgi:hypothetical protein
MSSLPHDKLLSAYLDGELNAAERAEAERLLETDPAARRLFEELKAMSAAIRALPQEKIGRDISRQVLRAAERRMLLEDEPKESAEPLARRIWRRATNPHTLVWLSLTAAIVVMIAIRERQQNQHAAKDADREVALSRAKSESTPVPATPSISAAPTDTAVLETRKSDVPPSSLAYKEPAKDRVVADADVKSAESFTGKGSGTEKAASANGPASKSAIVAAGKPANMGFAGETSSRSNKSGTELPLGTVAGNASSLASVRNLLNRQRQSGAGQAAPVVYCDISPEAARTKAFDKLLDANGIKWHRQAANDKRAADEYKKDAAEDVIDVEATPAQVRAALAGLAAQPEVFLAVSFGTPARPTVASGQWPVGGGSEIRNLKSEISNPRPSEANAAATAGTVTQSQTTRAPQSLALRPQAAPAAVQQLQRQQPVSIQKPLQSQLQQRLPQAPLDNLATSRQHVVFILRVSSLSPNAAKARN